MASQPVHHQQLVVTLLLILSMMCYLFTRSPTESIRSFGKRANIVHKFRQLRYTRELVEDSDGLFPSVHNAGEFTVTKVTDIARPVMEKKVVKRGEVSLLETGEKNPAIIRPDSQAGFIDEFLDNIFVAENMNNPDISSYSEDHTSAAQNQDYYLIEMFLDLILMVKIEESLNRTSVTPPSFPNSVSNTPLSSICTSSASTPNPTSTIATATISLTSTFPTTTFTTDTTFFTTTRSPISTTAEVTLATTFSTTTTSPISTTAEVTLAQTSTISTTSTPLSSICTSSASTPNPTSTIATATISLTSTSPTTTFTTDTTFFTTTRIPISTTAEVTLATTFSTTTTSPISTTAEVTLAQTSTISTTTLFHTSTFSIIKPTSPISTTAVVTLATSFSTTNPVSITAEVTLARTSTISTITLFHTSAFSITKPTSPISTSTMVTVARTSIISTTTLFHTSTFSITKPTPTSTLFSSTASPIFTISTTSVFPVSMSTISTVTSTLFSATLSPSSTKTTSSTTPNPIDMYSTVNFVPQPKSVERIKAADDTPEEEINIPVEEDMKSQENKPSSLFPLIPALPNTLDMDRKSTKLSASVFPIFQAVPNILDIDPKSTKSSESAFPIFQAVPNILDMDPKSTKSSESFFQIFQAVPNRLAMYPKSIKSTASVFPIFLAVPTFPKHHSSTTRAPSTHKPLSMTEADVKSQSNSKPSHLSPIFLAAPSPPSHFSQATPTTIASEISTGGVVDDNESRVIESGIVNKNPNSTESVETLLTKYMDSPTESTTEIYEKTLELIKKLTGSKIPENLLDFLDNDDRQEIKYKSKPRIQNFKHKKFAKYYRNLDVKMQSSNLPSIAQENILSALRRQLIATALDNKKLRQKANNLPAYRPVAKIDRNIFKSYYKSKILKMMASDNPLSSDVQQRLNQELQKSLTDQLGNVQAKLELKKDREMNAKKRLDLELRKSLRQQFGKVLPRFRNQA